MAVCRMTEWIISIIYIILSPTEMRYTVLAVKEFGFREPARHGAELIRMNRWNLSTFALTCK